MSGHVLTQQACVELGESAGIGAVEHDGVEGTNADPPTNDRPTNDRPTNDRPTNDRPTNDRLWCGSHAEKPMGPASVMDVPVERGVRRYGRSEYRWH
ncbi:MAG: hypothetical protein HHJ11_12835 [Phycicoccus sp.]|nr:hypothetical protein [Phycicoccus sp.]NMM35663.1 hypothetical protein [Phycicoccus sp.]